ncbi:MAG: hypothetical protein Q7K43_02460, partial [Candidatus Woesearchaeota archaeon]|nr:hypothetical protein [Candidatus Woesearchaeota archaeon]
WTLRLHDTLEGAYGLVLDCKTAVERKALAQKLYGIVDATYLLGKDSGIYRGNKAEPEARLLLGILSGGVQLGGFASGSQSGSSIGGNRGGSGGVRLGGSRSGGSEVRRSQPHQSRPYQFENLMHSLRYQTGSNSKHKGVYSR